ncbi:MAG: asparagine synthetase B, partial [Oscillospiraceae bacterium]|nr:asparagine synthetase B [Oscillospiraceae bacterium]
MCTIMGYCGAPGGAERIIEGLKATVSRGPDDQRVIDLPHGALGFQRLSIMGLTPEGMQPFELDGSYVVCNGELYGFRKQKDELIKKGYSFKSDSDCEILLPLYREYGTEMFEKLDAEFACIIYDGKKGEFIAARDPIGIRPLYYGSADDGSVFFASEPKNLVKVCKKIMPFPPGHYWKDGEFHCYNDITHVDEYAKDDIDTVCRNIHDKLVSGIEKRLDADAKVGFLLSGGLDSS